MKKVLQLRWHAQSWFMKWATTWQNKQNGCAPNKDSDQPGHPPSLIRVFAVRMNKTWVLSYPLSAQRRLWIRLGGSPGWSVSSLGALILLVLSCRSSNLAYYRTCYILVWSYKYKYNESVCSLWAAIKWATGWQKPNKMICAPSGLR